MARWIRVRLAGATGVALVILLAPSSASAACPPLDVACLAGELTRGPGDPITDPPADPGDPTGPLDRGVGPIVSPITDRLDRILDGESGGAPVGRNGTSGGGGRGPTAGRPPGGPQGSGPGPSFDVGRGAVGPHTSPSTIHRARPVSDADAGVRPVLGPILIGAARSIVAVLLLLVIAGVFVLIQDRIDRKDPKLSASPLRPQVIPFG
jgi:hypothetical protein